METSWLKVLIGNISSFLQMSSFHNLNSDTAENYYKKAEETLKLQKPILDALVGFEIGSDRFLNKAYEKQAQYVNELKKIFENWQPLSSKFHNVLGIESLISEIRACSLDIVQFLKSSKKHLPEELSSSALELCSAKIKHMGRRRILSVIEEALNNQRDGVGPTSETLEKIAENFGLRSNLEILVEGVMLQNLKENAELAKRNSEAEFLDQLVSLVTGMHDHLVQTELYRTCSPVPIPPDFCCPLSLQLMEDPVIVASGQTYERVFIERWIDMGLMVCPKSRQILSHATLTPNYIVKTIIASWCQLNDVKPPDPVALVNSRDSDKILLGSRSNQPMPTDAVPSNGLSSHSSFSFDGIQTEQASPLLSRSSSEGSLLVTERNMTGLNEDEHEGDANENIESHAADNVATRERESSQTRTNVSVIETEVRKLIDDLTSPSIDTQREATATLRLLSKNSKENRIVIANCGAIGSLVDLLYSTDAVTQENAATALLNLSIYDDNKSLIADSGVFEPLIFVLETGSTEAKENSAATLFSLSKIEENKIKIGESGAIRPLVDLLGHGTRMGKNDAATALFNLSLCHDNKAKIVQAGAVRHLIEQADPAAGMSDKAVVVLANLATTQEGRIAIGQEHGIPVLVEVLELGSARGKENAAATLLSLCTNDNKFCNTVLQEGAVPPLLALMQSGTDRAKQKAQALLNHFRRQRQGVAGRR